MSKLVSLPFAATTALLATTLLLGGLTARRIAESLAIPLESIDSHILGWTGVKDNTLPEGILKELKPTTYLSRSYRKESMELDLFIAFYSQQRAGESMHSPKHCLPGSGWEIWQHGSAFVPVGGQQIKINKYSIQNQGTRLLMFYWYQSKNRIVANEYIGKVMLARDTLLTGHTAGSIVRITLPDVPGANEEGVAIASKVIGEMQRCFGPQDVR
jgi:EpsI family protein